MMQVPRFNKKNF